MKRSCDTWRNQRGPKGLGRRASAQAVARSEGTRAAGGFTLLELALVLAMLVLLSLLSIGAMEGMLRGTQVQESGTRLAAMLRGCRADAALSGRHIHLSFDPQTTAPLVAIETDPLASPGTFQPHQAWWAEQAQLPADVKVESCLLTGGDAGADFVSVTPQSTDQQAARLATVTFYPDGSSDSAVITLVSSDPDHPWKNEIQLNGVDGTISVRDVPTDQQGQGQ